MRSFQTKSKAKKLATNTTPYSHMEGHIKVFSFEKNQKFLWIELLQYYFLHSFEKKNNKVLQYVIEYYNLSRSQNAYISLEINISNKEIQLLKKIKKFSGI